MLRSLRSAYNTLAVLLIVFAQSAYAETFEGPVVRVVDGDSLIVLRGTKQVRVRLKEIDAKKRARVSWRETDRNGRTLGRVWCAGVDANAEQVRRGMAWVFNRYDRSLYPLQEAARSDRLGLWADAEPIAPWNWRAEKGQLEYRAKKYSFGNALVAEVGFEPTSRALADPRMFPPTLLLRLARHRICEPLALLSKVVRVLPHFLGRADKQSIRQL
jgi:endonuclease YncB( thermonuclease family)